VALSIAAKIADGQATDFSIRLKIQNRLDFDGLVATQN
jgi:hypothetical protein